MAGKDLSVWITSSVNDILSCFIALSQLEDLSPSPPVNALFEKLVSLCRQTPGEAIANQVALLPSSPSDFFVQTDIVARF